MLMQYQFTDYLDLNSNDHYQLQAIMDNLTSDYSEDEEFDFFSIEMEG